MPRLNVRCCCTPKKVFGTVEVPQHAQVQGSFEVYLLPEDNSFNAVPFDPNGSEAVTTEKATIRVKRIYVENEGMQSAVYSDDRPEEFWQRVPTFRASDIT